MKPMDNDDFSDMLDLYRSMFEHGNIHVERRTTARIQNLRPHYTNSQFREAQTVYLAAGYRLTKSDDLVIGASYNYSDRLWQWDWEKSRAAWETAKQQRPDHQDTAEQIEIYLRTFFDDPKLKLVHILAGFNVSNGYDYQVYGYLPGDKETEELSE